MLSEEEIKQAFDNNSDCYGDTANNEFTIAAMTKEKFTEVVKELLAANERIDDEAFSDAMKKMDPKL
jgi:hypothetical protein